MRVLARPPTRAKRRRELSTRLQLTGARLLSSAFIVWLVVLAVGPLGAEGMSRERRDELREDTRDMFRLGYEGYMKYAYPADELRPLTCSPLTRDPDSTNIGINDVHANASITLLDVLTSLPHVLPSEFPSAVRRVATEISFDSDVKIQVFEMTIRALGSLLSTYQRLEAMPTDPKNQAKELGLEGAVEVKVYAGRILELALDLGKRLLPAFKTPTGIPVSRINLRKGVDKGETMETCTAGAGSLILEFSLLSRLTGDPRFEEVAHNAFMALWNRRSEHDLLGNGIGAGHGHWLTPGLSGIGAGIDSYFEYALKAAIMLDDAAYLDVFQDAYAAIMTHIRTPDGAIYRPVQLRLLQPPAGAMIDSLSAFFPAVQVLFGDLDAAIRSHLVWYHLWTRYDAIPESWEVESRRLGWAGWPGRPEFVESTYYLYQATKDDFYLRVGERVLMDMRRRTMTSCGFATMKDVETGEVEDRMESFVLSETLKYLYLLFADVPFPGSNAVFTTEGHQLIMPRPLLHAPTASRRALHAGEDLVCPAYTSPKIGGMVVGVEGRGDYEYTRMLVFGPEGVGAGVGSVDGGRCQVPSVPRYSFDIALSPVESAGSIPPLDTSPGPEKVWQTSGGDFMVANVDGLRLGVRWRVDGAGYDVSSIGPHRVRPGQHVFVADPKMEGYLPHASAPPPPPYAPAEIVVRISILPPATAEEPEPAPVVLLSVIGATALFGRGFEKVADGEGQGEGEAGGIETPREGVGKAKGKGKKKGGKNVKDRKKPMPLVQQQHQQLQHHELSQPLSGFTLGSGPVTLVRPRSRQGCSLSLPDLEGLGSVSGTDDESEPFVLFVERGGCTFLQKAQEAVKFGASGLVIYDYQSDRDDSDHSGPSGHDDGDIDEREEREERDETDILLRPSAEDEPDQSLDQVKGIGVVFVERAVGVFVNQVMDGVNGGGENLGERKLGVGVDQLERWEGSKVSHGGGGGGKRGGKSGGGGGGGGGEGGRQEEKRVGRLVVNDYEIWNLAVIESDDDKWR